MNRDAVWGAKVEVLFRIHARACRPKRAAAYWTFLTREGSGLLDFATQCVLAELHGLPWQDWPEQLRDQCTPTSPGVLAEHAGRGDFYCWLQWLLDDQLAAAQQAALAAGMPVGVVHDLAVGA